MDVAKFIDLFRKAIKDLYVEAIVVGRKKFNILNNHEHTYLINVAIYNAVKDYDTLYPSEKVYIAPELGGRSPSDFCLKSKNEENEKVELAIEHEHSRRNKKEKGNYNKIRDCYTKLINNKEAEDRLLICYFNNPEDKKECLKNLQLGDIKVHFLWAIKKKGNNFSDSKDYEEPEII